MKLLQTIPLRPPATDCDICEETRCSATTQTSQPMQKGQKTPGKEHKGLFYGGVAFTVYAVHLHRVGALHRIAGSFNICLTPRRCVAHEEKCHQNHRNSFQRGHLQGRRAGGQDPQLRQPERVHAGGRGKRVARRRRDTR